MTEDREKEKEAPEEKKEEEALEEEKEEQGEVPLSVRNAPEACA